MINKNCCKNHQLYNIVPIIYNFALCLSFNKKDSILFLENPRIVYAVNIDSYDLSPSNAVLGSDFLGINHHQIKQGSNLSTKSDKKNRSNFISDDPVDNKKTKLANKKKKFGKSTLNNDDFFIKDTDFVKDVNFEDLNFSLARPIKNRRQKKREKINKHTFNDIQSKTSVNNFTSSQNSGVYNEGITKKIILNTPLTVQQLAGQLNVSEASIITWLFLQGISVTINDVIDISIATKVAHRYGFLTVDSKDSQFSSNHADLYDLKPSESSEVKNGITRAPVVTIFGHVDHGKTTFLDYITKTNLVNNEVGGITQSIRGYEIYHPYMSAKKKIIFLDTPGHEAFVNMRLRSAETTDIAVLMVAADDGVQPQTVEAINYVIKHKIPYIVAINKADKEDIDLNKVTNQLVKYNIQSDPLNNTIFNISALTGYNITVLLDRICHLSNSLDLKANLKDSARGVIMDAYLDKKVGPVATIILKNGTLNLGDVVVAGNVYGKIKSIKDTSGVKMSSAYSSTVIQILGFSTVPSAGLSFCTAKNEKSAKNLVADYSKKHSDDTKLLNSRVTWQSHDSYVDLRQVNLILKADTQGSVEAIIYAFSKIPQNKVQINVISRGLGSIYDKDLDLALTSKSIILGFNVQLLSSIQNSAEKLKVTIKNFSVIYDLLDYIKTYMLTLMPQQYEKLLIGSAVVQTVFHMNKGTVAGCFVTSGVLKQNAYIIVYRGSQIVYEGILSSLKQLKTSVSEVLQGNECGVMCSNYSLWQKLDNIEVFDMTEKTKVL